MPVINRNDLKAIRERLSDRYAALNDLLYHRDLMSSNEGAGRGSWTHPDKMCATVGSSLDIRLAVEAFKAMLAEVKNIAK